VNVADIVTEIETAGVAFQLEGERVHVEYPDDERREELAGRIAWLRARRDEVIVYLKARSAIPPMPEGVRLARWEPKPAPIALTRVEIVTDVPGFVTMTLMELKAALVGKRWLAGNRSVRELIDRLDECGVVVEVNQPSLVNGEQRNGTDAPEAGRV
jgi:hypothetical protein